jgi:hypothetical protein
MVRAILLLLALLLAAAGNAWADPILDSNGPIDGASGGWYIGSDRTPNRISDSFTLANPSNLTGVQLGLWTFGPEPATVQWSIGTTPFGSDKGSGTANLTSTFRTTAFGTYSVFSSTFPLNQPLGAGTYWLSLQDASASGGSTSVYWDQNLGPSSATQTPSTDHLIPSESFQIFGTETIASPEPASIILLGIGIAGLATYGGRARAKKDGRRPHVLKTDQAPG